MWLEILDRLLWLMLGMAIGASLGWTNKIRQEVGHLEHVVEPETHPVDPMNRPTWAKRHPRWYLRGRTITNIQMAMVVLMTVWAALSASLALSQVRDESKSQDAVLECSRNTLEHTIRALDERSRMVEQQSQANMRLQRAQADYLQTVQRRNRLDRTVWDTELWTYREALAAYIRDTEKILNTPDSEGSPYPEVSEYTECVRTAQQIAQED